MKVSEISVQNIKGITNLSAKIGAVTIIGGRNGEGKSSFLDAVAAAFNGGHSPELIRKGSDKGEVAITLDNGTVIKLTITEKASTLKITTGDGAAVKAPATFIKTLANSFAFDPISFLDARTPAEKEKRLKFLLDAMPISFSKAEIVEETDIANLKPEYSIEEFDALRTGKRDERTAANAEAERFQKSARGMKAMLPDNDPLKDWLIGQNLKDYHPPVNEWKAKAAAIQTDLKTAEANLRTAIAGFRQDIEVAKNGVDEWAAVEIEKIRQQATEQKKHIDITGTKLIDAERIPLDHRIQELTAELATAREKAETDAKAEGMRESALSVMKELEASYHRATVLDKTVKALDGLRKRKLDALPVEGVEIRNGEIFYNGIAFDHVNMQQRIFLTFQIVSLKMGELPLLVLDGLEMLDADNREMFIDGVKQFGYQVIAAEVNDGDLAVVNAA